MALKPVNLVPGDTWTRAWSLTNAAGVPIDLTGASARLHVRNAAGVKVTEASVIDGRISIDSLAGRINMSIPPAGTALTPGKLSYSLEITFADASVRTIETNTLQVVADITYD